MFGDEIDIYDIEQAIADGATVRIYYESRLVHVGLKAEEREFLDDQVDKVMDKIEGWGKERLKTKWAPR